MMKSKKQKAQKVFHKKKKLNFKIIKTVQKQLKLKKNKPIRKKYN